MGLTSSRIPERRACRSRTSTRDRDGRYWRSSLMRLLQTLLLRFCADPETANSVGSSQPALPALGLLLRVYPELIERIHGKRVLDFGCGPGTQAIALATAGAARVVGVDLNTRGLQEA